MLRNDREFLIVFAIVASAAALALGQSSSLANEQAMRPQLSGPAGAARTAPMSYGSPVGRATPLAVPANGGSAGPVSVQPRRPSTLAPAVAQYSLTAVALPDPRAFQRHDLITIVVSETTSASSGASLGTTKEISIEGEITEFPRLQLSDLLDFQVNPSNLAGREPRVEVELENEFEGEGEHERRDTFSTLITAEIIDIKPNGNLVLSAQKFIQHDKETLEMTLTGVCRPEDVSNVNSVRSGLMHNLTLIKKHTGEVRKASKKGWLTKLFEGIFNI